MFKVPNKSIMNACSAAVTTEVIIKAMMWTGLTWHMTIAQVMALESDALKNFTVVTTTVELPALKELSLFTGKRTLMGIPIVLDSKVPHTTIELRLNGEVIYKIEALAIPSGTPWNYEEEKQ